MNEKYREVEAWLEKIFGNQPVPKYEINSFTLDTLTALMHRNKIQDQSAELVRQDLRIKAEEYGTEADRCSRTLQKLGLSREALSQSGNISLKTLVEASVLLEVQTPSHSNHLLAMSADCEEKMSVANQRRLEQQLCSRLLSKTKAQLKLICCLRKVLENLDEQASLDLPDFEKKGKTTEFLRTKSKEYMQILETLKKELASSGAEPSIYHSTLMKKSEDLTKAKEKLHSLKAKLDSYHALPPDISLARVKIEEVKAELASLEAELAQCIDLMHL